MKSWLLSIITMAALLIFVYLLLSSQNTVPVLATVGSTSVSAVRAFQGR
jgi:hypothetical protein